jgi:hypothetical protein
VGDVSLGEKHYRFQPIGMEDHTIPSFGPSSSIKHDWKEFFCLPPPTNPIHPTSPFGLEANHFYKWADYLQKGIFAALQ